MQNFIKPNKFKIRFTVYAILFGGFIVGCVLIILGYPEFIQVYGQNVFLNFIQNFTANLFSHFILIPSALCRLIPGPGMDFSCFFSEMFKVLILQSIIFYLLSCSLYNKNWKLRFWRIYFFLVTIIHIDYYSGILLRDRGYRIIPSIIYFDIPITTIALLGLFLFAAERDFLSPIFWRAFFFVYIAWDTIIIVSRESFVLKAILRGIIFLVPLYLALFFYGFKTLKQRFR